MNTPLQRFAFSRILVCALAGFGSAVSITPAMSMAGVTVGGTPEAVTIQVESNSVAEVLDSFFPIFNVHCQTSVELKHQISGTYKGTLSDVLKRILRGYQFVLKSTSGLVYVTVFGLEATSTTTKENSTVGENSIVRRGQTYPINPMPNFL